ncbi:hypothetical protein SRHO_G00034360, partial [Serrasalmus rhombeus]
MAASKEKALDLFPEYKMDYKRRGTVLIFNQERFFWTLKLRERSGTATDKENLTERFQQLGFNVETHDDLNKNDMMDKLRK